jgi:hypothetical protein
METSTQPPPPKAKSAYWYFQNQQRPLVNKYVEENQPLLEGKAKSKAVMQELSKRWKSATADDKAPYTSKAETDKHRYKAYLDSLTPEDREQLKNKKGKKKAKHNEEEKKQGKTTKKKKKGTKRKSLLPPTITDETGQMIKKPDKPKSAFLLFCDAERQNMKQAYANLRPQDIMKKLGEMWTFRKQSGVDQIQPFIEKAKLLSKAYEESITNYRKLVANQANQENKKKIKQQ